LTNKHIFNNNFKQYYIKINNINYRFSIIEKYNNKDLILWKIKDYKNNDFLKTNNFKKIKLGTTVFTIINKEKKYWKIIFLNKELISLKLNNLIETNIKLKPWDSWTPLFNKDWIVIGINTAIDEIKNTSFSERIN
jgi:S1-C subfamily serine protease